MLYPSCKGGWELRIKDCMTGYLECIYPLFLHPHPKKEVTGWVLQRQTLRWSSPCKMFIRDWHLGKGRGGGEGKGRGERERERAGLGRGRSWVVMQAGISPPWGALEHMWSITVIPVGLKELGLYTHHIVGHGLWAVGWVWRGCSWARRGSAAEANPEGTIKLEASSWQLGLEGGPGWCSNLFTPKEEVSMCRHRYGTGQYQQAVFSLCASNWVLQPCQ